MTAPGRAGRSQAGRRGVPRAPPPHDLALSVRRRRGWRSSLPSAAPPWWRCRCCSRPTRSSDISGRGPAPPQSSSTESENGASLCLRPEFTIPVCLDPHRRPGRHAAPLCLSGRGVPPAPEGGNEFFQAGIEDLGDRDTAAADARSVADAHELLSRAAGRSLAVTLGDQAVFEAGAGRARPAARLAHAAGRAFGSHQMLDAPLPTLPTAAQWRPAGRGGGAGRRFRHGGPERPNRRGMEEAGLPATVGRTPADIARRLIEKAQLRSCAPVGRGLFGAEGRFSPSTPRLRRGGGAGDLRRQGRTCAGLGAGDL